MFIVTRNNRKPGINRKKEFKNPNLVTFKVGTHGL